MLIYVDRDAYDDEWKDDLENRKGVESCKDGSEYEGNYRKGKKHDCTLVQKSISNFIFKLLNIWFNFFKQADIEV